MVADIDLSKELFSGLLVDWGISGQILGKLWWRIWEDILADNALMVLCESLKNLFCLLVSMEFCLNSVFWGLFVGVEIWELDDVLPESVDLFSLHVSSISSHTRVELFSGELNCCIISIITIGPESLKVIHKIRSELICVGSNKSSCEHFKVICTDFTVSIDINQLVGGHLSLVVTILMAYEFVVFFLKLGIIDVIITIEICFLELCDRLVINIPIRGNVFSIGLNDRLSRGVCNDCSNCESVFHCVESKLVLFCYDNLKFYTPFILRLLYVIHCSRTI